MDFRGHHQERAARRGLRGFDRSPTAGNSWPDGVPQRFRKIRPRGWHSAHPGRPINGSRFGR